MSDFKKAFLWTAIPISVLSIISVAGGLIGENVRVGAPLGMVWFGSLAGLAAAFVALIVFIMKRRNRVAAGIIAGMAIGIVAMGATCFANVRLLGM